MLHTKKLTTIALYLLMFCCPPVNKGYCATPSTTYLSNLALYVPVTTTIGLVKLASSTTVYASQTIGAAAKIEASSTVSSSVAGIIIAGTLDGSHENSITSANPPLPALLICATTTNTTKILDIGNLTIDTTGWLTSRNTATLAITTAVKGDIYNHGSITGDTCVQIGKPSALTDFLLDGNFTNKGLISANQPNGKALVIAGNKTANINSFSVHNFGMLSGNLDFEAKSSDFKYKLENINYIVKHGNYQVGDRDDSIIEAATLEVKNANLTVYNEHIVNITNLTVQATTKTIIYLQSKSNIFSTSYHQGAHKHLAQIKIKDSLINSNLGVITTAGTVMINKLDNPYHGTVTFTDSHINLQEVTNSGYIQAQKKLSIAGIVTNSVKGYLDANDSLIFNKPLTNIGTITAKKILNINAQADNSGHINALAGLGVKGVFNNSKGVVTIKTGSATFSSLVTNSGTITAETGLLVFYNRTENLATIIANNGIEAHNSLVNHKGATLSISGKNKAHISGLINDGAVFCKDEELKLLSQSLNRGLIDTKHGFDGTNFTNQQGATLTVSGLHATFSKKFINSGYINSKAHVSTNLAENSGILIATAGMHATNTFTNAKGGSLTVSGGDLIFKDTLLNYGSITTKDHQLELHKPVVNNGLIDAKLGMESSQTFINDTNARLIIYDYIDIQGNAKIASIKYAPLTIGTATISKLIASKNLNGKNLTLSGQTTIQSLINSTQIIAQSKLILTEMSNSGEIIAKGKLEFTKEATNAGIIEAHKGLNISSGTFTNKKEATLAVNGGNFQVDAFLANSGAISSTKSACFLKDVTNSGVIQANYGLHAHEKLTNSLGGHLIVKAKPLQIHGDVINYGTITSEKPATFDMPVLNNGFINARLELGMYGLVTNAKQAHILASGGLLTITGTIENSGLIAAKQGMLAKSFINNNTGSRIFSCTEKIILTEVSNSGYIEANAGLIIKGSIINASEITVKGHNLNIFGTVTNSGTITSAKQAHFFHEAVNSGYLEANSGLTINGAFTNKTKTIIKGDKLAVNGMASNSGTITSTGFIIFQKEATNSGYIQADGGFTIAGSDTFVNDKNAQIKVAGKELTIHGMVVNFGTITSAKQAHFFHEASNSGYLEAGSGLTIDGAFTNTANTVVNGSNFTVHGIVSNSGTITSTGFIAFKEEATNSGYIQADAGFAIAGSDTFVNDKNAQIKVAGKELIIYGMLVNFGTITSAKQAHFFHEASNSGYLEAGSGLTIDGAFTNKTKTIVNGSNFTVHGIVSNSGTITSTGFIAFKEEATNSGYIQADAGFTIAGSDTFVNDKNAQIKVAGKELTIHGMVVNFGTITSAKQAHFFHEASNSGYLEAGSGLTIDGAFTNTANTVVNGSNFTVHGIVSNSGTITSTGFIAFKEEATNSGYIQADGGFTIAGSDTFVNDKNAQIKIAGKELTIHGMVVNFGTITSAKQAHFFHEASNSGYLEAGSGLTIDGAFTNTANTVVNGSNFTVHGIVSNSGTITSTGFIAFKEEATNSGYIQADAGFTIAGSDTFVNDKNAQIKVAGKELTIYGMIVNLGTITSAKQAHFFKEFNNKGYLRSDSGLTIDGAFTNTANTIVNGENLTIHGIVYNSGTITSAGLIITGSLTNNKNSIITVATNELTVHGMAINFGTITSDNVITFTKEVNNSSYITAKYGITANADITNFTGGNITLYGDIKINGKAFIKGMTALQHGNSFGTSTISNLEIKGNKDVVFFGSSTIGKLTNTGFIRSNAPLIIIESSNSGKIIADDNLTFVNTTTNTGAVIANEHVMQFNNNLYNIGNIKARAGLIVTGTLTNYNNSSVNIHDAVEIENTATILGINNTGSRTIVFGTATIAKLINHSKTHIHFSDAATVTKLFNHDYILADATISLGEVSNTGSIRAKKTITINGKAYNENYIIARQGLIANATFINAKLGSVLIDYGTASFNDSVDNFGIVTTNNARLEFNNTTLNAGDIIAKQGLTAKGKFTNKNGSVTVSGADAIFDKYVDNTGVITANDHLSFNDTIVNSGEIRANDQLDINTTLNNKAEGKVFGSEVLRSSFNIIENQGFIAVAAGSDAKEYHGYADSELQITLPVIEPKSQLFYVANTAKFDSTAKIILDATTDLDYLQHGAKIKILKANTILAADNLNELLYRYIKPKNYFISISDAIIINNGIEVTVQQDINKILNLTDKYVKFSKSLLRKNTVNINSIKVVEAMSDSVKLYHADKNSIVLDQITDIITKNNITGIDINNIREEISIPGYETHKTAEIQNKITSKVSNKLKTDKKQYKHWKNKGINFKAKETPDVIWLLTSYQQGKDRNTNKDNQYKKYQDKIICLGVKHDIASFDAGFSVAYMYSNDYLYSKNGKQTSKQISSATKKSFLLLLHAMRDFSDFNTLIAFSYGQANHKSSYKTTFDNRSYSALFSANYEIHINNIEIELGLTSRLIHIYTPSYNMSNNNQTSIISKNSNSDYFSLGPMMSIGFNQKLSEISGLSMELSTGYLHTVNINKEKQQRIAFADYKLNLQQSSYAKNSFYLITKIHFFRNNIFLGLDFNWNHDAEKNIYGISIFTGLRF